MKKVGFIGLGTMGSFMAQNIMAAGFPLYVYNRTAAKTAPLAAKGATVCESPADVGRQCEICVVCVADAPDVEEVIMGPSGIAAGMKAGGLIIDCTTSSASLARRMHSQLAEREIGILDAPVSGGPEGARSGSLVIMVGGETDVFERAYPVLQAIGLKITLVGGPGAGQLTKAINQIIVGANLAIIAEGIALARKNGLDAAKVVDAIVGGAAKSWALSLRGPMMLNEKFRPPKFALALHAKDFRLALEAAEACGCQLDVTETVAELFKTLTEEGFGGLDHSGIYLHTKNQNGL